MTIPTLPTILVTAILGLSIYFFQKFYERMMTSVDSLTSVISELKAVIADIQSQNTYTIKRIDIHEIRLKELEITVQRNIDLFDFWHRKKEIIIKNIPDK